MTFSAEKLQSTIDYLQNLGIDARSVIPRHPRLLGYSVATMERNLTSLESRGLPRDFLLKHHFVLGKTRTVHKLMDVLADNSMAPATLIQQEPALLKRSPSQIDAVIKLISSSSPRVERILGQRPMVMTVGLNELRRRFQIIAATIGDDDMPGEIPDLLLHSSEVLQDGLSVLRQVGMRLEPRHIRYALRAGLRNVIAAYGSLTAAGAHPTFEDVLDFIAESH